MYILAVAGTRILFLVLWADSNDHGIEFYHSQQSLNPGGAPGVFVTAMTQAPLTQFERQTSRFLYTPKLGLSGFIKIQIWHIYSHPPSSGNR